jgi:hypothetical protein
VDENRTTFSDITEFDSDDSTPNEMVRTPSTLIKPRPRKINPPRLPDYGPFKRVTVDRKIPVQPRSREYTMDGRREEIPIASISTSPEASVDMRFCAELKDRQGVTFINAYSGILRQFSETGSRSLVDAVFHHVYDGMSITNDDDLTNFGLEYRDFLVWVQVLARSERPDFPTIFPPLPWLSSVGMTGFSESIPFVERYVSMGSDNLNFQTFQISALDANLCENLIDFQTAIDSDIKRNPFCYTHDLCPVPALLCNVASDHDAIADMLYSQRRVAQINHSRSLIDAYQAISYGRGEQKYIAPPSRARYPADDECKRYVTNVKAGLNKVRAKRQSKYT